MTATEKILAGTEKWHEERRSRITSSDVGAILGGPGSYNSELAVWARLTGKVTDDEEDEEEKPWLEFGRRAQHMIADWYSDKTGRPVKEVERLVVDQEFDWLAATPDYTTEDGVLECKAPNIVTHKKWREEKALQWKSQLMLQMRVMGLDWGVLAIGSHMGLEHPEFERSEQYTEALLEALVEWREKFWLTDIPPPAQYRDWKLLSKLCPGETGQAITLGNSFAQLVEEEQELAATIKESDKRRKAIKATMMQALGENSYGVLGDSVYKRYRVKYTVEPKEEAQLIDYWVLRQIKALPEEVPLKDITVDLEREADEYDEPDDDTEV